MPTIARPSSYGSRSIRPARARRSPATSDSHCGAISAIWRDSGIESELYRTTPPRPRRAATNRRRCATRDESLNQITGVGAARQSSSNESKTSSRANAMSYSIAEASRARHVPSSARLSSTTTSRAFRPSAARRLGTSTCGHTATTVLGVERDDTWRWVSTCQTYWFARARPSSAVHESQIAVQISPVVGSIVACAGAGDAEDLICKPSHSLTRGYRDSN